MSSKLHLAATFVASAIVSACSSGRASPPSSALPDSPAALADARPSTRRDAARPGIVATYREAANVFEIMDNVAAWSSSKCDPEYRAYWDQRIGPRDDDPSRFAAYKAVRKRYFPRPPEGADASTDGADVFAPLKPFDPFAQAFYGSETVDEALSKLEAFMAPEDVAVIAEFHAAYRDRLAPLLAESKVFGDLAKKLSVDLASAHAMRFYDDVTRFYGVTPPNRFTVLFVWWPPVEHVAANNRGAYLLMKYNPAQHRETALASVDVPVHELAHYVSSHQSDARKRTLGAAFLSTCKPTPEVAGTPALLEEPMAVAIQKTFARVAAPQRFSLEENWYGAAPWIDEFSHRIFGDVSARFASGDPLDEDLMRALGAHCAEASERRPR